MARPRFILCAEGIVTDQATNLLSCFNIVEKIIFAPHTIAAGTASVASVTPSLRAVAEWSKEETDGPDDQFEHEASVTTPGATAAAPLGTGPFTFGQHDLFRIMTIVGFGSQMSDGVLVISSRIRKLPDGDWVSQECRIPVLHQTSSGE